MFVLSRAKCAQKNWRAQAKLLGFVLMILCVRPKQKLNFFKLLVTDYFQFAEQQTLNCYDIG